MWRLGYGRRESREGVEKVETEESKTLGKWKTCPDPGLWTERKLDGSEKQANFPLVLVLFITRSHLARKLMGSLST